MDSMLCEPWVDGPGGAGVGVADVDGAGRVEEEGTSVGLALAFLAPLKLTIRSPKFQQFFLM